jgi:lipopolysaccharide biosynthesis glycosyltransferase
MKIALTTTLDDSYIVGFLITFSSILNSNPNFDYDLIILEWGKISNTNKEIIKKLYNKIIFKPVDVDLYKNHKFDDVFRKWSYNCNYRFDIFTLDYDKVLYFDCDFIFEIPIHEMLKKDIDFGACQMPNYTNYDQVEGSKIFNAGLMIVGKKYLNNETREELIKIANTKPTMHQNWTGNQPILNKYFLDKITWLPITYNTLSEDITIKTFSEKRNYHFIGKYKPWAKNPNQKFDQYILRSIANNVDNVIILNRIIFKKIQEKCDAQNIFLKSKGINIDLLESSFN